MDAAAEAEARLGVDTELALGAPDAPRFPGRRFEQDVAGLSTYLAVPAAHHAADAQGAGRVGDQDLVRPQLLFGAVERGQSFALVGETGDDAHRTAVGIPIGALPQKVVVEGVVRLTDLEHHVVADVDHVADGPLPGEVQPVLHPVGRRPLFDAFDQQGDEARVQLRVLGCDLDPAVDRRTVHLKRVGRRHKVDAGERGDLAGSAHDRGAAGDVRDHVDVEHDIAEHLGQRSSWPQFREFGRRLEQDDAFVIVAEPEFRRRTQHRVAGDAAQFLRLEPRDLVVAVGVAVAGAGEQEGAPEVRVAQITPLVREQVGRSGDHLARRARTVVDRCQDQAVGVRHRIDAEDLRGHDQILRPRQLSPVDAEALDRLDLQAGVREQLREFLG